MPAIASNVDWSKVSLWFCYELGIEISGADFVWEPFLKEIIECPKSPEKVKTIRSKRQKLGEMNL